MRRQLQWIALAAGFVGCNAYDRTRYESLIDGQSVVDGSMDAIRGDATPNETNVDSPVDDVIATDAVVDAVDGGPTTSGPPIGTPPPSLPPLRRLGR